MIQHTIIQGAKMKFFPLVILVACYPLSLLHGEDPTSRPNVILMMADDMGMGDTSAYQDFTGNSDGDQIHTPAMQRLANSGVRFTDAHTPSSRCSPTRYGLLTGRYPWRNRLKFWVLFGVQGDPMIERDRPTLGTLMKDHGYRTGLVGKWHVGLRYRRSDGGPADGWSDADLRQPMYDTPLDHGFDQCWFTSRSHGTSGPATDGKKKANGPKQSVGPGHVEGREVIAATENGKQLVHSGPEAYVLSQLGSRHSDHAIEFLSQHRSGGEFEDRPFFLYYPSNSNHGPHTPDIKIGGRPVKGAGKSVAGDPLGVRCDYIYENDVALGRMLDFLQQHEDPRRPGKKLIDNTIVIFTSDNGAEKDSDIATGPFRSNKGSTYEGGHRVPLIVSWAAGGVGDGDSSTPGQTNQSLIGLHDMFATFTDVLGSDLPDPSAGEKGGEDSTSVLAAWRGERLGGRPMFFHDHKQAKADNAVAAFRLDDPVVDGQRRKGKWKLFFDANLLRRGIAQPIEFYDLANDPKEQENLVNEASLKSLVASLTQQATLHRTAGGHRLAVMKAKDRFLLKFSSAAAESSAGRTSVPVPPTIDESVTVIDVAKRLHQSDCGGASVVLKKAGGNEVRATIQATDDQGLMKGHRFDVNARGLGVDAGEFAQVDQGETIVIEFDQDVIVESAAIVAGNGVCGGFYTVGDKSPLAIYCVDADIDSKDQSGVLSDIGVVKKGEKIRLSSSPHYGVETPGRWRLAALSIRTLARGTP